MSLGIAAFAFALLAQPGDPVPPRLVLSGGPSVDTAVFYNLQNPPIGAGALAALDWGLTSLAAVRGELSAAVHTGDFRGIGFGRIGLGGLLSGRVPLGPVLLLGGFGPTVGISLAPNDALAGSSPSMGFAPDVGLTVVGAGYLALTESLSLMLALRAPAVFPALSIYNFVIVPSLAVGLAWTPRIGG